MICKRYGARIGREDLRADGLLRCPDCGKLYRVRKRARARGIRARRAVLAAGAVAAVALVALAVALAPGGG